MAKKKYKMFTSGIPEFQGPFEAEYAYEVGKLVETFTQYGKFPIHLTIDKIEEDDNDEE